MSIFGCGPITSDLFFIENGSSDTLEQIASLEFATVIIAGATGLTSDVLIVLGAAIWITFRSLFSDSFGIESDVLTTGVLAGDVALEQIGVKSGARRTEMIFSDSVEITVGEFLTSDGVRNDSGFPRLTLELVEFEVGRLQKGIEGEVSRLGFSRGQGDEGQQGDQLEGHG